MKGRPPSSSITSKPSTCRQRTARRGVVAANAQKQAVAKQKQVRGKNLYKNAMEWYEGLGYGLWKGSDQSL